ncbi:metallophosphoesterase family protein [Beggiatoa alba]|nr:metallophosphoesterase family protein [Beggiatoa alba]
MLKRIFKVNWPFFLILVALFGCARVIDKSIGGIYDAYRSPYLQSPTSRSIVIRWQTRERHRGVVRVGEDATNLDKEFTESSADDEHSLKVTGLKPNTKYYYTVGTREHSIFEGSGHWFKTSPDRLAEQANRQQPIRFWVTGDQGQAGEMQSWVRDAMLLWTKQNVLQYDGKNETETVFKTELDFWLTLGDNAYRSGTNKQFQENFFAPYATILKHTPVWPAYGNHDARRWVFYNIFTFPTQGEAGGRASSTEHYYSFDYGSLHVVMLDSQSRRLQKNSKMLRWLRQDLASTQQQWVIAVFHHPPYSKGTHDSDNLADSNGRMQNVRKYVLPVLEQAGVDVVLTGHSHMYERSWFMNCHYGFSDTFSREFIQDREPQADLALSEIKQQQNGLVYRKAKTGLTPYSGTIYVTMGSSAKLDQGDLNHPAMPVSLHENGSMVIDIMDNKLTANFIMQDAQVADKFTIIKGVADAPAAREQCQ